MRLPSRVVWPGVLLALLLSSGWAQDPFPRQTSPDELAALEELLLDVPPVCTLSVDGPQTAKPGQLVRLDALVDKEAAVLWHLVGATADAWDTANGGTTVFFATPIPGRYTFLAVVACQGAGTVPEIRSLEHVVTITGPAPSPAPGPGPLPGPGPGPAPAPTPPPAPVFPVTKYGVAPVVYAGVCTLPEAEKPKAAAVAENYAVVASQIAAGTIRDFETAIATVRRRNEGKLDPNREAHVKAWGTPLAQQIGTLKTAGKLATPDDWRAVMEEAATALRTWGAN